MTPDCLAPLLSHRLTGPVILNGNDGNDILRSGDFYDVLSGGIGNDQRFGGLGNDTLNGGTGVDFFEFLGTNDAEDLRLQRVSATRANFVRKPQTDDNSGCCGWR